MRHLFVLIFSFTVGFLQAQEFKLLRTYETKSKIWDVDPLGFIVYAQADMIYKLDTAFNIQFKESFKYFGEITSIDAKHAQKTLLFSENMQQISFLDNTLTPTVKRLSLEENKIDLAKLVCFSQISTRFWVYDDLNSKLIRFDQNFAEPIIIENLNLLLSEIELINMFEENNKLYLISKNKGIYVFDNFGSLINHIEIKDTQAVRVVDDQIYYLEDNSLFKQSLIGHKQKLNLPVDNILDFRILGNYIYLKSESVIKKYSLKLK